MDSLVLNTVATTIVGAIDKAAKDKAARKKKSNRVVVTKRGSDGFVKKSQVDDKHLADMADQEQGKAAQQEKAIAKVEKKLKLMTEFDTSMAKEGRVA